MRIFRFVPILAVIALAACTSVPPTPRPPALAQATSGPARVTQEAGWTIVRLSGTPSQIGEQHGSLLAERIDDAIKVLTLEFEHDRDVRENWAVLREATVRICWPKVPTEYREEIEGIARGVQSRGYSYDWQDILTLNAHIEMAGYWLPMHREKVSGIWQKSGAYEACSAFVATGSATADGRVVMGQNFWWSYLSGQRFNVILDITPTHGHRMVMDSLPGLIHSGTDFAINAAGLMITETTIGGFKGFDEQGVPEFVRIRRATQYATTIHEFAATMRDGNNGGYANAWLVADGTGEIGKLELGLKAVAWNTTRDGYYFGANFPEDPKVIALDCPGYSSDGKQPRRVRWEQVLSAAKGRIDVAMAKEFLGDTTDAFTGKDAATGSTLCGRSDLDPRRGWHAGGAVSNRIATTDLTAQCKFLAKWGFADGSSFDAAEYLRGRGSKNRYMSGMLWDIPNEPWIEP